MTAIYLIFTGELSWQICLSFSSDQLLVLLLQLLHWHPLDARRRVTAVATVAHQKASQNVVLNVVLRAVLAAQIITVLAAQNNKELLILKKGGLPPSELSVF